jgi:O-antigen/teichoic acid export membrane protein
LTAGRAAASAISLVWTAVVARTLSERAVGALSLGLTLSVALSILPDLGLPMIVCDRVARHPEETRSLVRHVVRIRLAASLVTAGFVVGMFRLGSDATLAIPLLLSLSVAATVVHTTATAALRGVGLVVPDATNEVVSRLFVLGVGAFLLTNGGGVVAAAGVLAAADLGSAVVLSVLVHRQSEPGPRFPSHLVGWRVTLPLAGSLLIGSLHTRIDVWLLAVIGHASDVAHYALPARLAEGLLLPAGVASALVLPLTGRHLSPADRGRHALRYVATVGGVVSIGALVAGIFAGPVLRIAFGGAYGSDGSVLRLLCVASLPTAIGVGLAPIVAMLARRAFLGAMAVALVVNVVTNVLLIPHLRELGAAVASLVSTTVLAALLVAAVLALSPPDEPDGTPSTTSASPG